MWKYHPEYIGEYRIYKSGKIYSEKRGKFLSLNWLDKDGYRKVNFLKKGVRTHFSIHRLVAELFVKNPKKKPVVNHIDGNKLNNNDWNLEWNTHSENDLHAYKLGLRIAPHQKAVLQFDLNGNFINDYKSQTEAGRQTRICNKAINACIQKRRKEVGGFVWKLK